MNAVGIKFVCLEKRMTGALEETRAILKNARTAEAREQLQAKVEHKEAFVAAIMDEGAVGAALDQVEPVMERLAARLRKTGGGNVVNDIGNSSLF